MNIREDHEAMKALRYLRSRGYTAKHVAASYKRLFAECQSCRGVGYFGDPADGQNCKACHGSGVALNEPGQPT